MTDKNLQITVDAFKAQLICLTSQKKTGKIAITVEVNLTQGAIGSAYLGIKENINFGEIIKL